MKGAEIVVALEQSIVIMVGRVEQLSVVMKMEPVLTEHRRAWTRTPTTSCT